ncbi:MAG: fibronectin type III domain-containing protein [Eubacterium sp.]|nr:fibronectin type III domain-containing protein [Eubacterium sp.]
MKKILSIISIIICITMLSNLTALAVDFETETLPIYKSKLDETGSDFETDPIGFETEKISISKCSISNIVAKTYSGKAKTQSPTVKYKKTTLKKGTDYTLSYKNNTKVGTATVTITGKGSYKGSVKKTFKINPKGTTISKLSKPKSKQIKVSWKKQKTQTTGYQIQIATNSSFTKSKKLYTISKNTSSYKTLKSLKKNKKYYVRIRTYKKIGDKKYYSSWSKYKSIKTK